MYGYDWQKTFLAAFWFRGRYSPCAIIGDHVKIYQQVTIGARGNEWHPIIENNVLIGAGAKILGSVHVGNGAKVGANSVVLSDVPANATAVGLPAKIIQK